MSLSKKLTITLILTVLIFTSAFIIWYNTTTKQEYSVGMAVEFNDHAAAAWVAHDKGWFKNVGINITTFESYATGLALAAAIARDDIQVAYLCIGPAILAYARGIPIKIVALTHEHGYAVVTNTSLISDIKSLDGKKIGCVREGSNADLLLNKIIKTYALENITILRMKPMDQINALEQGQLDAITIPEHYVAIARSRGFDVLIKSQDIWPNMPGSALVVKQNLIDQYPEAIKRLVNITVYTTNWIKSYTNEAAQILAEKLQTTQEIILDSMTRLKYTNTINTTAIEDMISLMVDLGYIDHINASEIIDDSFLNSFQELEKSSTDNKFDVFLYLMLSNLFSVDRWMVIYNYEQKK